MSFLTAVGITVGVLAGIWAVICTSAGWLTWAGFVSWAAFYAAGGKTNGLKNTLAANISGVIWGLIGLQIINIVQPMAGASVALFIAITLIAAAMCWQANLALLAFIPGSFLGCATFFGANVDAKSALIGLIGGAVFGYASEWSAILMSTKQDAAANKEKA